MLKAEKSRAYFDGLGIIVAQNPYGARARAKEYDMVKFAAVVVIEGETAIGSGSEVISSNALAGITLLVDGLEVATIVTQNPYSTRARAIEGKVILLADVIIIEGKDAIGSRFEIVSSNSDAWIALLIDGRESALVVAQNPDGARSGTIEGKIVKFPASIVIKGQGPISGGSEVISTDADAWITLLIDGRESAIVVAQNPYGTSARAIQHKMIKFTGVLIIKCKDLIGRGFEVISTYTSTWITLLVDSLEISILVTQNPYRSCARAVENDMVKFAAVVVIEGEGAIGRGFQIIPGYAMAWITFPIHGHKRTIVVANNPYSARSGAIEYEVVKFTTVIVIEGKGEISEGSEVISSNSVAWITLRVNCCECVGWSGHVELELRYNESCTTKRSSSSIPKLAMALNTKVNDSVTREIRREGIPSLIVNNRCRSIALVKVIDELNSNGAPHILTSEFRCLPKSMYCVTSILPQRIYVQIHELEMTDDLVSQRSSRQ
jgi:hypothetical protein